MYRVNVAVDVCWVPDGSGNTFLGVQQANNPGQGQPTQNPMIVPMAQTRRYITAEGVPGGDTPTLANISTALTTAVADIAGATGTPFITAAELALIQGWATGGV